MFDVASTTIARTDRKAGVAAYQWNMRKAKTAPPYKKADAVSNMHFCDLCFYHKSLDDAIDAVKSIEDFKWGDDLRKYKNQAYIFQRQRKEL